MLSDIKVRREIVTKDHSWFFSYYLTGHHDLETAPFQHEMLAITEDPKVDLAVITAFRDSGKSTICTLSGVLWSVLGCQKKKMVIIIGKTLDKAQTHLVNIKHELENNEMLRKDLGPFQEISGQWGLQALIIPKYNTKVMVSSVGQSVRGEKYLQSRPDLIILDDVEDLESVKTKESRDNLWNWFVGEVLPARSHGNSKVIVVGNHLHEDSLLKKLQKKIEANEIDGVYREYPIMDKDKNPLWPARYPNMAAIEAKRKSTMDERAWYREFLLIILPDEDQIVKSEWLQEYEPGQLPDKDFRYAAMGVDLAISQRSKADSTAIIPVYIYGSQENLKVYLLPHPINKQMTGLETLQTIKNLSDTLSTKGRAKIFIENNGMQQVFVEQLQNAGYPAVGMPSYGSDKPGRFKSISHLIQGAKVFFPKGCYGDLRRQMLGFGVEAHDDLVDALTLLLQGVMKEDRPVCRTGCFPVPTWSSGRTQFGKSIEVY